MLHNVIRGISQLIYANSIYHNYSVFDKIYTPKWSKKCVGYISKSNTIKYVTADFFCSKFPHQNAKEYIYIYKIFSLSQKLSKTLYSFKEEDWKAIAYAICVEPSKFNYITGSLSIPFGILLPLWTPNL